MKLRNITPILNVTDIGASLAWFEKLGWKRGFTWNNAGSMAGAADVNESGPANFGSVCAGESEIFLCRGAQGSRGGLQPRHLCGDDDTGGVWMSWWLKSPAEVDAAHALALKHGMTITHPPTDEPWGVREFHLVHPDGHTFRVSAGICDE